MWEEFVIINIHSDYISMTSNGLYADIDLNEWGFSL